MSSLTRMAVTIPSLGLAAGCRAEEPPVRGLVTEVVEDIERSTVRRHPGVLEPGEANVLSSEVSDRLGRLVLGLGQRVREGDPLAKLQVEQRKAQIEHRRAAVAEAEATLARSEADLAPSQQLLDRGVGTVVSRDEARTAALQSRAWLTQARQDLASAEQDLADSKLSAPFDGIVDAIEVESFATVSVGQAVLTVCEQQDDEVSSSGFVPRPLSGGNLVEPRAAIMSGRLAAASRAVLPVEPPLCHGLPRPRGRGAGALRATHPEHRA